MFEVIQKIIDLIAAWLGHLVPWAILGDDQVGLVRRLGKYHRDLRHGFNWKIPVIEIAYAETSALDSTVLREQSLTTSDNVQVTLRGVIAYRVVDPRKYILDCATAISVMNDVGCCVIAELIPEHSAEEVLRGSGFMKELLRRTRVRARRWGVEVDSVGIVDRTAAPAYRLIGVQARSASDWVAGQ